MEKEHKKDLRFNSHMAETNAVLFAANEPWSAPGLRVTPLSVYSETGLEVYTFMSTMTSHVLAARLLSACYTLISMMHDDKVYHLDCHPKNMILSKTIKEGAAQVDLGDQGTFAVYVIDLETMYHPNSVESAFEEVTDSWNAMRVGGLGRMPYSWYRNHNGYGFDVYTFSTYVIQYVDNTVFTSLKRILYFMCRLPFADPLPHVYVDTGEPGTSKKYYTYLTAPRFDIKTARDGADIYKALSETLDAVAYDGEN